VLSIKTEQLVLAVVAVEHGAHLVLQVMADRVESSSDIYLLHKKHQAVRPSHLAVDILFMISHRQVHSTQRHLS
jgi:hypothetical protein